MLKLPEVNPTVVLSFQSLKIQEKRICSFDLSDGMCDRE